MVALSWGDKLRWFLNAPLTFDVLFHAKLDKLPHTWDHVDTQAAISSNNVIQVGSNGSLQVALNVIAAKLQRPSKVRGMDIQTLGKDNHVLHRL